MSYYYPPPPVDTELQDANEMADRADRLNKDPLTENKLIQSSQDCVLHVPMRRLPDPPKEHSCPLTCLSLLYRWCFC